MNQALKKNPLPVSNQEGDSKSDFRSYVYSFTKDTVSKDPVVVSALIK